MGGDLLIESAPGQGTKATIRTPIGIRPSTVRATFRTDRGTPSVQCQKEGCIGTSTVRELSDRIGILLVDDHAMVRQRAAERAGRIRRCGGDRGSVERQGGGGISRAAPPAVVVMDINMPHINGIDATMSNPGIRHAVIGLCAEQRRNTRRRASRRGHHADFKEAAVDELYLAIRQALAGENARSALPADR